MATAQHTGLLSPFKTLLLWGLVGFAILSGFVIYASSRTPLVLQLLDNVGLSAVHEIPHAWFGATLQSSPEWVRFNLPDGLWIFALVLSLHLVWADEDDRKTRYRLAAGVLFASIGSEILQAMAWIGGTGDPRDAFAYAVGTLSAAIMFSRVSGTRSYHS
jgi:hypothetical protein